MLRKQDIREAQTPQKVTSYLDSCREHYNDWELYHEARELKKQEELQLKQQ